MIRSATDWPITWRTLEHGIRGERTPRPHHIVTATLALALMMVVIRPAAAASDGGMEANSQGAAAVCTFTGGTATIDYVFNADGSVASMQTTCSGGQAWGQVCTATPTSFECTFPFTQPTQTPTETTRPGAGGVVGVVGTSGQIGSRAEQGGTTGHVVKAAGRDESTTRAKHAKGKAKSKHPKGGKGRKH